MSRGQSTIVTQPFKHTFHQEASTLDSKIDKYSVEGNPMFTNTKQNFKMTFASPRNYKTSMRTEILAMPKT
jgi:hypothetical protein